MEEQRKDKESCVGRMVCTPECVRLVTCIVTPPSLHPLCSDSHPRRITHLQMSEKNIKYLENFEVRATGKKRLWRQPDGPHDACGVGV